MFKKVLSLLLMASLLPFPQLYAQQILLPVPGARVNLSAPYNPLIMKGIKININDPFQFEFIIDNAVETPFMASHTSLKDQSIQLIKYFLAALTTPEKDMWVNLSPYEKDRIVPESFGQTVMGRDLLAQDYLLKQVTASLIYPEEAIGKEFWKKVYEESATKHGGHLLNVSINTFNKVWIVPGKAEVYENIENGTAYVVESSLKVMLEEDFVATNKNAVETRFMASQTTNKANQNVIRSIVIPVLTKEINEGANFAQLRQVYNSLILATWYKKKIRDSLLSQVYQDQNKIKGAESKDDLNVSIIYRKYLEAFKKGAYNYIKDELDPMSKKLIPKKYFSGGMLLTPEIKTTQEFLNPHLNHAMRVNVNLVNASFPHLDFKSKNFNWNPSEIDAMNIIPSLGLNEQDEVLSVGGTAVESLGQVRWEYLFAGFGNKVNVYQPDQLNFEIWNRFNRINQLPLPLMQKLTLIKGAFNGASVKQHSQSVIILPAVLSDPDIDAVTLMQDALGALQDEKYIIVEWYNSKDSYQAVEFRKTEKVLNVFTEQGYVFDEINRGENTHHQWRVYKVKKPSLNQIKFDVVNAMEFEFQSNVLSQDEVAFQENVIRQLPLKAQSRVLSIGGMSEARMFNGLTQMRLELLFAQLGHHVRIYQPNMNAWLDDLKKDPWVGVRNQIEFNQQHFNQESSLAPDSQSVVMMMSVLSSWGISHQKKIHMMQEALKTLMKDGYLILGWYNWDEIFKLEEYARTNEVLSWFRGQGYIFEEIEKGESQAHEWVVYQVKKPDVAMVEQSLQTRYQHWVKQMDGRVIYGTNGKKFQLKNTYAGYVHQDEFMINEVDESNHVVAHNIGELTVSFKASVVIIHGMVLYNSNRDDRRQAIFSKILATIPQEMALMMEDVMHMPTLKFIYESIQNENLSEPMNREISEFSERFNFQEKKKVDVIYDDLSISKENHALLMRIFLDYQELSSKQYLFITSMDVMASSSPMGRLLLKAGISRPIQVEIKKLDDSFVLNFFVAPALSIGSQQVDAAMSLTRRSFLQRAVEVMSLTPIGTLASLSRFKSSDLEITFLSEQISFYTQKHFDFHPFVTGQYVAEQLNEMARQSGSRLVFGQSFIDFYDLLRHNVYKISLSEQRTLNDDDVKLMIKRMVDRMNQIRELPQSPYIERNLRHFFEGSWLMYMLLKKNGARDYSLVEDDLLYQADKYSPQMASMIRKMITLSHDDQSVLQFQNEWNVFNERYVIPRGYFVVLNVNRHQDGSLYFSSLGYQIIRKEMKILKTETVTVLHGSRIASSDDYSYLSSSMENNHVILIDVGVGVEQINNIMQTHDDGKAFSLDVFGVKMNQASGMLKYATRTLFKHYSREQVEQYVFRKASVHELAYQAKVLYNVTYRGHDLFGVDEGSWNKQNTKDKNWIDHKVVSYLSQFIHVPDARSELIEMYANFMTGRSGAEYIAARWIVNMMDDAPKSEWTNSRNPEAMNKQFARLMAKDPKMLQLKAKELIQEFWSVGLLKVIEEDFAMSVIQLPMKLTRRQFNLSGVLAAFLPVVNFAQHDNTALKFLESKKKDIIKAYSFLYSKNFLSMSQGRIHVVFQQGLRAPKILPGQNIVILSLEKYAPLNQEDFFAHLVLDLAFYGTMIQYSSKGKANSVVNYQKAQEVKFNVLEELIDSKILDNFNGSIIVSEVIGINLALQKIISNDLNILNRADQLKEFVVETTVLNHKEKRVIVILRNRDVGKTVRVVYDIEHDTLKVDSKVIDSAQMSQGRHGGIDFNGNKIDLRLKDNGEKIAFDINDNLIKRYHNVEGFFPIVTGMVRMPPGKLGDHQLRVFLGLK